MFSLLKKFPQKKQIFFLFIVIVVTIFSSFHCIKTPLEPVAPTWDVPLTFRVIDKTYSVQELLDKGTDFDTTSTGEVIYHPGTPHADPTPITFPDLNPLPGKVINRLDLVPLNIPTIPIIEFSFQNLAGQPPPPIAWSGGEQTFSHTQTIVGDTSSYEYIVFKEGRINLTVTNTSKTVSLPLAGTTMYSILQIIFSVQTVNMNGKTINPQAKISFTISIDGGIENTSATLQAAKLQLFSDYPLINLSDSIHILDDSTFLKRAEFRSGSFDVKITNYIPTDIVLSFSSKEFTEKSTGKNLRLKDGFGVPQDTIMIPSRTTYQQRVNLPEYVFQSQEKLGNDTIPIDYVRFYSYLKTLIKNNDKVLITEEDSLVVEIIPAEFPYIVDNIVGKMKPTLFDLSDTVVADLGKLGEKITADSITFENISAVIKMHSPSYFPADVQFTIVAQHQGINGNTILKSPAGNGGLNDSYRLIEGDTTIIVLDKNNSTIDKFFSQFFTGGKISLPDKFLVYANATIFPQDLYANPLLVGHLRNGDSIYTTVEFTVPMRVGVSNGSYRDTVSFDPDISSSIKEGKMDFYFENKFPSDFDFSVQFFKALQGDITKPDTREVILSFPQKVNDPKVYPPISVKADVTPERKGVKGYTYTTLTREETEKLLSARFMILDFKMKTVGNGPPVKFTKVDKLRIKSIVYLKYLVKSEQ